MNSAPSLLLLIFAYFCLLLLTFAYFKKHPNDFRTARAAFKNGKSGIASGAHGSFSNFFFTVEGFKHNLMSFSSQI